jgi:zeaxanthin glucosyltransferase
MPELAMPSRPLIARVLRDATASAAGQSSGEARNGSAGEPRGIAVETGVPAIPDLTHAQSAQRLIAFLMLPEYSALNATFQFAKLLRGRGHRVIYLGPSAFEAHVTRQGLEYDVLRPWWPYDADAALETPSSTWREKIWQHRAISRSYDQTLKALDSWLEQSDPALVFLDPINWTLAPPLLRFGTRIISLSITLGAAMRFDAPPVFSGTVPPDRVGLRERLTFIWEWLTAIGRIVRQATPGLLAVAAPKYWDRNALVLVRRHGGRLRWGEYGPRLAVPEMVTAPKELEFATIARRPTRLYLGSCVDEARRDGDFIWPGIRSDRSLVYCSLGTYSASYPFASQFLAAVVDAMRDCPEWEALVQVGASIDLKAAKTQPTNVHFAKWVPQIEILRRATIFITHGGCGSVREGIHCAVPMLVVPCWYDQFGNAARVAYHRIGLTTDISTVGSARIRSLLLELVHGEYTANIQRMRARIRKSDATRECARFVESVLSESPPC